MEPIETERLIIRRMRDDDLRDFLEYESDSEHTRYLSRRAYTGDQARDFIATEPFYSMTRRAGDTLYLSGFGPVDDDLNVVGADIGEQTRFTMDAIRRTLQGQGATMAQLVRVNVFLLEIEDRDGFNSAYMEFFDGAPMPTRRLVGAGDMYKQILVEIDGIAWLGN